MSSPVICIVTVHGIGDEKPPVEGVQGYADGLHVNLNEKLTGLLSDDPGRQSYQSGASVPIYVQSAYPLGTNCREDGMKRLGKWDSLHLGSVDGSEAPLIKGGASIAHVALVYSQMEGQGPQVGASIVAGGMTIASIAEGHYAHVTGVLRMLFLDSEPFWSNLFQQRNFDITQVIPGLFKPQDKGYIAPDQPPFINDFVTLLRQLENDVAAYVCHNEMREDVRRFVLDALLRLASRDDVAGIVINSHSNGTVVALDVLRSLPPYAAKKILAFITAGSPLRKYATLFSWGQHMATVPAIETWMNFWDKRDPVADRLKPSIDWLQGNDPTPEQLNGPGLFQALDPETGKVTNLPIEDKEVDNLTNSKGGGMQAHNYWDNDPQFIEPMVKLLKGLVQQENKQVLVQQP